MRHKILNRICYCLSKANGVYYRKDESFIDMVLKVFERRLPKASFVGFTATPIEKEDVSTTAVFGNYIDVWI